MERKKKRDKHVRLLTMLLNKFLKSTQMLDGHESYKNLNRTVVYAKFSRLEQVS